MLLHWYACISMNIHCYVIYHILLEAVWWALSNTSLIVWIPPAIHEILTNKYFTVTDDLISWLFVVAFVHPAYVQIALIWGFPVQLSLWKSVHWLWRYKLNEVCNSMCVTRVITNYVLIGKYQLRFFPRELFECPYESYPIESRYHILHNCRRYNKYWNSNRKLLKNFVTFLEFIPEAFSFHKEIT